MFSKNCRINFKPTKGVHINALIEVVKRSKEENEMLSSELLKSVDYQNDIVDKTGKAIYEKHWGKKYGIEQTRKFRENCAAFVRDNAEALSSVENSMKRKAMKRKLEETLGEPEGVEVTDEATAVERNNKVSCKLCDRDAFVRFDRDAFQAEVESLKLERDTFQAEVKSLKQQLEVVLKERSEAQENCQKLTEKLQQVVELIREIDCVITFVT